MPFKGEKKRSAPDGQAEEGKNAVTLDAIDTTPEKLAPDATFPGPEGHYELLVKGADLFLHGLSDCIVSAQTPIAHFWGRYLCGSTDKKDIAKFQGQILPWQMSDKDFEACFAVEDESNSVELASFPSHPQPLIAFLRHLEENSVVTEECFFLPQALPKNTKLLVENAASVIAKDNFDWTTGLHSKKHLQIYFSLEYHAARNTILPRRPKLFLTSPVKMSKGQIVQLT